MGGPTEFKTKARHGIGDQWIYIELKHSRNNIKNSNIFLHLVFPSIKFGYLFKKKKKAFREYVFQPWVEEHQPAFPCLSSDVSASQDPTASICMNRVLGQAKIVCLHSCCWQGVSSIPSCWWTRRWKDVFFLGQSSYKQTQVGKGAPWYPGERQ